MSTFAETLHPREQTGQFAVKEQSAPELSLDVTRDISAASAALIQDEAPIGAETARVRYDEYDRTLIFSGYADEYGRAVPAGNTQLVDVALSAANPADLEAADGVIAEDIDGELIFTIDVRG
jgi:hypothetical protein